MEVRNQEGDVVALRTCQSSSSQRKHLRNIDEIGDEAFPESHYLDSFSPQHKERLCSLRQKTCELVHKDVLDLVGLLDLDTDPH